MASSDVLEDDKLTESYVMARKYIIYVTIYNKDLHWLTLWVFRDETFQTPQLESGQKRKKTTISFLEAFKFITVS